MSILTMIRLAVSPNLAFLAVLALAGVAGPPTALAQGQCSWQEIAKIVASDAAEHDNFGDSVALSGDTAVVGAAWDDHAGGINAGSAYVFVRSGPPGNEVWTEQAKLTASDAAANDRFGTSVALSGDTAVIGANSASWSVSQPDAGSVYIFVRVGGVWTQQAKLTNPDPAVDQEFGDTVALSGDTVIVGTHLDHVGGSYWAGSAYVFVRSGTVWTQQARLTAS